MNNTAAGLNHYFDPEPSSTQSNPDTVEEHLEAQDWVPVDRSRRGASSTKAVASGRIGRQSTKNAAADNEAVNEQLHEKFHRTTTHDDSLSMAPSRHDLLQYLDKLNEYSNDETQPRDSNSWLSRPDVPTAEELFRPGPEVDPSYYENSNTPSLQPNIIDGPWQDKEEYLSSHFELLRENATRPLREATHLVQQMPYAEESDFLGKNIGLYQNVRMIAATFGNRGIAVRIAFSLARVGKKIRWEQSKRLISGSLVVLTPVEDLFQSQCTLAVVAARPLVAVEQNPPEIDLYFANPSQIQLDPEQEWLMMEVRTSYFEAQRHTMRALQKMMREAFPLSEHLIHLEHQIKAPGYIECTPFIDLSNIFEDENREFDDINILEDWPPIPSTELDNSQLAALQRVLTKKLALIQGPPGTGKTYVSVVALKAMISNMTTNDPLIIIACQTNHALDQLLRHVSDFEPEIARLGGRSKDPIIIQKTLYEIRKNNDAVQATGASIKNVNRSLRHLTDLMIDILEPLKMEGPPLHHKLLRKLGLLTEGQCRSIEQYASSWTGQGDRTRDISPIELWVGNALIPAKAACTPEDFGYEYEEADLEVEQLQELEAENTVRDDEDLETIRGSAISISDNYTGKAVPGMSESKVVQLLKQENLLKIPGRQRGSVYSYLQKRAKSILIKAFRKKAELYDSLVRQRNIAKWEQDALILRTKKVVGLTMTGLSKYRALISSLSPKIVLIEEAAETLEAPVIAACVPSLEHLILVGDHKQLRPHCDVKDLEGSPFYLDVSLFERLRLNDMEFSLLSRQRRMAPDIRRLLRPVYKDVIKDHPSVLDLENRPLVPGMGDIRTFFFTHEWEEAQDDQRSFYNQRECDMIVGFVEYLLQNGLESEKVTILTFYNGQRKRLLRELHRRSNLKGNAFTVVTVDSYQGEENEVVLLSLVRSNNYFSIGFAGIANRVCVALSRARCGFYIFGNGELFCSESKLWSRVVEILAGKKKGLEPKTGRKMCVGYVLHLQCNNHERKTFIEDPDDWSKINGGCEKKCKERLLCGHKCPFRCHVFEHDSITCDKECGKTLSCGHKCTESCSDDCICLPCAKAKEKPNTRNTSPVKGAAVTKSKPPTDLGIDHNIGHGMDPDSNSDILLQEASAKGNNRLAHLFTESKSSTLSSVSVNAPVTHQSSNTTRNRLRNSDKALPERRPPIKKTLKRQNVRPSSSSSSADTSSVGGDEEQHLSQHHPVEGKPTNSVTVTAVPKKPSPQSLSPQPQPQQQQQPILGDLIDLNDMDLQSPSQSTSQQHFEGTSSAGNKSKSDIPDLL